MGLVDGGSAVAAACTMTISNTARARRASMSSRRTMSGAEEGHHLNLNGLGCAPRVAEDAQSFALPFAKAALLHRHAGFGLWAV